MKLQLDTEHKTVKLESEVLLSKLIETLSKLLPNGEWKKFTLETNTVINQWSSPIIVREYPTYPRPYWGPWYMAINKTDAVMRVDRDNATYSLKSGVYNVEA